MPTPLDIIVAALVVATVLFFRDALRLSRSRPGRRFTDVHPWERWLHPAKPVVVAIWAILKFPLDLDRPVLGELPDRAAAALGWSGAAMALAGIAFACWAKRHIGRQFASRLALHENHELVTSGPYRITRNPIYSGALLVLWGIVLASPTALDLAVWGIFFPWMLWMHALGEEMLLQRRFGDTFRRYKQRVPRLIPFV